MAQKPFVKVLIVESSASRLRELVNLVESINGGTVYRATVATRLEAAREEFDAVQPDVIMCSAKLPDCSTSELVSWLLCKNIPSVVLVKYTDDNVVNSLTGDGFRLLFDSPDLLKEQLKLEILGARQEQLRRREQQLTRQLGEIVCGG